MLSLRFGSIPTLHLAAASYFVGFYRVFPSFASTPFYMTSLLL